MADDNIKKDEVGNKKEDDIVQVPLKVLTEIQEKMANMELGMEEMRNKNAGLEELLAKADTDGEPKLREKRTFEPKFRTLRIRKYPVAGDVDNLGYIVGWDSRGAYEEVDKTGVAPIVVNYINVFFLGREKNAEGKLQAEKVKLLDLLNKGIQVHCKILDTEKKPREVPTGEEINVSIFDPQHGMISTGETIDGYVSFTDIKYKVQIPGVVEPVWIDSLYCNS